MAFRKEVESARDKMFLSIFNKSIIGKEEGGME
jgi:hypothetical protein